MAFVYYNFSDDDNICFADRSDYADRCIFLIFKKTFSSIVPSMLCEAKWQLQLSFLLNIAFFKEENVSRMKNGLNFQLTYGFKNIWTGVLIS